MFGPQHLLPGDLVDVLDRGPPDEPFASAVQYRWHASDAAHAISVEPDRYKAVEHAVAVTPHAPGYSAVTREMIGKGFNEPLQNRTPAPAPVVLVTKKDKD